MWYSSAVSFPVTTKSPFMVLLPGLSTLAVAAVPNKEPVKDPMVLFEVKDPVTMISVISVPSRAFITLKRCSDFII